MFAINNMDCTDTSISWEALEEECIRFICAIYGQNNGASLAEIRHTKWIGKCKANTMISFLRLNCLPPTEEAVKLNIKRAHYQCSIWRNVKMVHPTVLLNEECSWIKDTTNKCLDPTPLEPITPMTPDFLMKVTFCGCSSSNPCSSQNCSCRRWV